MQSRHDFLPYHRHLHRRLPHIAQLRRRLCRRLVHPTPRRAPTIRLRLRICMRPRLLRLIAPHLLHTRRPALITAPRVPTSPVAKHLPALAYLQQYVVPTPA